MMARASSLIGGKRRRLVVRCLIMTQVRASQAGTWAAMTIAANTISWQAAAMTLAALVVSGVLRLLAEWQRRQTFMALMVGAPEGTVVIQHEDRGGQSMRARLGSTLSWRSSAGS